MTTKKENSPDTKLNLDAAYQRGYRAGKKATSQDTTQAFWDAAYLVALKEIANATNWRYDGKPANSVHARTEIAANFADTSVYKRNNFKKKRGIA